MARLTSSPSPAEAYRRVEMDARIFGSDAPGLARLCLEEAASALNRSIYAENRGHVELGQRALCRALDAICALRSGLDPENALNGAFTQIYDNAEHAIRGSMLRFDPGQIQALARDLEDIRAAFRASQP